MATLTGICLHHDTICSYDGDWAIIWQNVGGKLELRNSFQMDIENEPCWLPILQSLVRSPYSPLMILQPPCRTRSSLSTTIFDFPCNECPSTNANSPSRTLQYWESHPQPPSGHIANLKTEGISLVPPPRSAG